MNVSEVAFVFFICTFHMIANATKCHRSVNSVWGIFLIDHVMDSFTAANPLSCYMKCAEKPGCQSINFYLSRSICELNNRTIENTKRKPGKSQDAVYFMNPNPVQPIEPPPPERQKTQSEVSLNASDILRNHGNTSYYEALWKFLVPVLQSNKSRWIRCWRAKTQGWDVTKTFHPQCDNKGPTITLVRVGQFIFGGYSDVSWTSPSSGDYGASSKAFLFSLYNKNKFDPHKFVIRKDQTQHAICRYSGYGPVFGYNNDLFINNHANNNENSFLRSHTYNFPPDKCPYGNLCSFYTNTTNGQFTPSDIEVLYRTID